MPDASTKPGPSGTGPLLLTPLQLLDPLAATPHQPGFPSAWPGGRVSLPPTTRRGVGFPVLTDLNRRYGEEFGFPFILAVKGYNRAGVNREFARRVEHDRACELAASLAQVARIARLRFDALIGA